MKRMAAVFLLFLAFAAFSSLMILPSHASMSSIRGTVYWYDMYGNLRPLAWAQVIAEGEARTVVSTTTDGTYIMWVVPGTYNVTVSLDPGYTPVSKMVTVSPGGVVTADFQLEPSGKPVPEYPPLLQPAMLVVALLVAVIMIRRREQKPSTP